MATRAEVVRAFLTLDKNASAVVSVGGHLLWDFEASDLEAIADALEALDACDGVTAPAQEHDALAEELDSAKTDIFLLEAKIIGLQEEISALHTKTTDRAVERDEWHGKAIAAEKRVAELEAKLAGRDVKAEALPSRDDLETVLRECLKISDLHLGVRGLGLREEGEQFDIFAICEWDEEVEDVEERSFAEAIAEAASLLRAKKAEG